MPYRECETCALRLYSAARWSTHDRCPRCGAALRPPPRSATPNGRAPDIRRRFPPGPGTPNGGRRALEVLSRRLDDTSLATGRLLVSELLTNSVVHGPDGRSTIELRVWAFAGALRIEVVDEGAGIEAVPSGPEHDDEWHWGLHLVESLADRWGTARDPEALVWFELDGNGNGAQDGRETEA